MFLTSVYVPNGKVDVTPEIEELLNKCKKRHLLCGDFNAKHKSWGSRINNQLGVKLSDLVRRNNMACLNTGEHTFMCASTGNTDAIDLTFVETSLLDRCSRWKADTEGLDSDHFPTTVSLSLGSVKSGGNRIRKWKIAQAD